MKKGFTLVELIVVIAIVAILAAVSVVSYIAFINSANESADIQLVKQLNVALQADEALNGPRDTMHEMLGAMEENGFVVENLTKTKSGNDIVWDEQNNRFALVKADKTPLYGESKFNETSNWKKWYFVDTNAEAQELTEHHYSVYLTEEFANTNVTELDIKAGLDVGNYDKLTSISYKNISEDGQEVVIRTLGNMCELTIYAPQDHIDHYGYAKETNVVKVANASYHEFGTSSQLVVASGKVVVENSGVVFELKQDDFKKTSDGQYISETKYNAMENKPTVAESFTKDESPAITNNGGNVMASSVSTVTASTSFEINNLAQLEAFRDATNSGETFAGRTINLNCDITLKGAWTPISNYNRDDVEQKVKSEKDSKGYDEYAFAGTFEGNNHKISGLTNKNIQVSMLNTGRNRSTPGNETEVTYGFFASVNNATIRNVEFVNVNICDFETLKGDRIAACVGYANGSVIISNITVRGSISGYDVVGGIVGGSRGTNIFVENCQNYADIIATRQVAGIVGQLGGYTKVEGKSVIIRNCKNFGNVSNDRVDEYNPVATSWYTISGIANVNSIADEIDQHISNCENKGTITTKQGNTRIYDITNKSTIIDPKE